MEQEDNEKAMEARMDAHADAFIDECQKRGRDPLDVLSEMAKDGDAGPMDDSDVSRLMRAVLSKIFGYNDDGDADDESGDDESEFECQESPCCDLRKPAFRKVFFCAAAF
jgi:hypothetical protein